MADDSARIRADIEQTREELGDTVEALATELSPRTQWERALDRLREDPKPLAVPVVLVVLLWLARRRR